MKILSILILSMAFFTGCETIKAIVTNDVDTTGDGVADTTVVAPIADAAIGVINTAASNSGVPGLGLVAGVLTTVGLSLLGVGPLEKNRRKKKGIATALIRAIKEIMDSDMGQDAKNKMLKAISTKAKELGVKDELTKLVGSVIN